MTMVSVSQTRLNGSVAPRISFLDDALALLPRRAAIAYFGVADAFEACIPPCAPRVLGCTPSSNRNVGHWRWAETRVTFALSQVQPPLSFAAVPTHGTRPGCRRSSMTVPAAMPQRLLPPILPGVPRSTGAVSRQCGVGRAIPRIASFPRQTSLRARSVRPSAAR